MKSKLRRTLNTNSLSQRFVPSIQLCGETSGSVIHPIYLQHAGESGDAGKVHEETEQKLQEIAQQYKENKQKVIAKMMESLVTVKPAPHENSVI